MRAQKAMKEEMAEKRFVFDAFVSYTRNDQKWVIKELLQRVEREANVKLCLHQRYGHLHLNFTCNVLRSNSTFLKISFQLNIEDGHQQECLIGCEKAGTAKWC